MGTLVMSIDFELRWGVLDIVGKDIDKYKENLLSVHENVPWMLKIFQERNIAATWATVGALGCDNWDEFDQVKSSIQPSYKNKALCYDNDFSRIIDPQGELYFAPGLIRKIIETPWQELGTHTFGHIYGTEPDVSYDELKEDLLACKNFLSKKFGYEPQSLVYPRNQVIYEEILLEEEIVTTYRGNESVAYFSADKQRQQQFFDRAKRLLDAINPYISHAYDIDIVSNGNIPSSAIFRIYLPNMLRKMHLKKLKKNIINLKSDEVYHIWFHPHNLGTSQKKKDDFVRFFDFIGDQICSGRLESENMNSLFLKRNT